MLPFIQALTVLTTASDDIGKHIGCDVHITGSYTGNFLGRRIISG